MSIVKINEKIRYRVRPRSPTIDSCIIELLSRRRWTTGSAQPSNMNGIMPCMCCIIFFGGVDLNTHSPIQPIQPSSPTTKELNGSMLLVPRSRKLLVENSAFDCCYISWQWDNLNDVKDFSFLFVKNKSRKRLFGSLIAYQKRKQNSSFFVFFWFLDVCKIELKLKSKERL